MKTKDFKKLDIKTRRLVDSVFLGNYKSSFKWRWLEFSEFRSYEYGDDAKYIDWLVSAREWKTIIRRYEEERELNILFVLDLWASMNLGVLGKKLDLLKEIFFILGLSAVESSDRIGAILFWWKKEKIINFKKWKVSLFSILKEVENYNGENINTPNLYHGHKLCKKSSSYIKGRGYSFLKNIFLKYKHSEKLDTKLDLSFLNKTKIKNSLVFILTDKLEVNSRQLGIAERKNDLVFINVFDSFENNLNLSKINVTLGSGLDEINIDLADDEKKKEYVEFRKEKIDNFSNILHRNQIDYLYVDETKSIYRELMGLMSMRGER